MKHNTISALKQHLIVALRHWAIYLVIESNPSWAPGALLPSLSWHRADSCNRRTCQSFWSLVAALSSLHSLWYWIVAAFCVAFQPTLNHRRESERETDSTGGRSMTFFPTYLLYMKGTAESVCHFCPHKKQKPFKGEDERREMAY